MDVCADSTLAVTRTRCDVRDFQKRRKNTVALGVLPRALILEMQVLRMQYAVKGE